MPLLKTLYNRYYKKQNTVSEIYFSVIFQKLPTSMTMLHQILLGKDLLIS